MKYENYQTKRGFYSIQDQIFKKSKLVFLLDYAKHGTIFEKRQIFCNTSIDNKDLSNNNKILNMQKVLR